jgi:hypothetical protein
MNTRTWTYTTQRAVPAKVYDEQGCLIASIHNLDDQEANEIAALMAAAPRLLAACKLIVEAKSIPEARRAHQATVDAIAATEVSE